MDSLPESGLSSLNEDNRQTDDIISCPKCGGELRLLTAKRGAKAGKQYLSKDMLRALPKLSIRRSLISVLGDCFREDKLKLSFTFQSKYLGMSAWDCPGAFAILPYVEFVSKNTHV